MPCLSYPERVMLQVLAVVHVLLSASLISLILMHSGRDAGLGGMGFTPTSQGARTSSSGNLTRLTLLIAALFREHGHRSLAARRGVALALHHVTCVCSMPSTVDFYRDGLGFTLVKKTVNSTPAQRHLLGLYRTPGR